MFRILKSDFIAVDPKTPSHLFPSPRTKRERARKVAEEKIRECRGWGIKIYSRSMATHKSYAPLPSLSLRCLTPYGPPRTKVRSKGNFLGKERVGPFLPFYPLPPFLRAAWVG